MDNIRYYQPEPNRGFQARSPSTSFFSRYPDITLPYSFTSPKVPFYPCGCEYDIRRAPMNRNMGDANNSKDYEWEYSTELTCGPRSCRPNAPPDTVFSQGFVSSVYKSRYNLPGFETEYASAKFYVIKSYSEDDIHKSVKYDVWSSTPNGNKKLDAAFMSAKELSKETGLNCPVFLFFSVNGSGQFVGLAEMVGNVDFSKDMDFWQIDKWTGFFPVEWHVIKDVPNNQLRHIILENNNGRSVTFSRDTQEIGLKQGLEMLNIFKNFSEESSLLDDFNFYENRERILRAKKRQRLATLRMRLFEDAEIPVCDMENDAREPKTWADWLARDMARVNLSRNPSPAECPPKDRNVARGAAHSYRFC